ncbi:MAG TPA: zinc ribbon domain-containing protein [Pyrinomonadaceae bacterium]|jgi:hypothetical protein|nr:zinc ribbon domain-containing protein [Pyrinomonadaceae bacterium]
MISKTTCDDCGTLLVPGARFCRQCGKLVADPSNSSSVTEATTRVLDAPAADSTSHTQYVNSAPTGPAYMAPGESSFVQPSTATTSLQTRRGRTVKFLLVGFALVLLFVTIISFVVVGMLWSRRPTPGPIASAPEMPRPFPPPNIGPPPPNGGPPGAAVSSINEFIYPGAETVMNFGQGDGGAVLQLRTADPFDKVFAWYAEKFKPAQIVRPPGGSTGVIRAEKVAAVLTVVDGQTNIMLKHDAP